MATCSTIASIPIWRFRMAQQVGQCHSELAQHAVLVAGTVSEAPRQIGGVFYLGFETAMLTEARRRKCDGVVCGHIHKPEMREVNGNDGDWVESLSALVEHHDGRLELIDWQNVKATINWHIEEPLQQSQSATES